MGLFRNIGKHTDAILAVFIIGLIMILIIPIPSLLLDALICFSIVFSVMALLLAIYVEDALEFSAFPSLLLFLTLYRLGLNIASTRMILTHGKAGDIIHTFGDFVIRNNLIVGLILFSLITVINFIVITKGAGRIAEVTARFTLEALPGKQMAIDGEFSSGLISIQEAKEARKKIGHEAQFYGAMDGASKFVRGDAIASLVMIAINIFGGLASGFFVKKETIQDCFVIFTRLTIGEGLACQIPALLISVSAGIMMTRISQESVAKLLSTQVFHHPKVMMISGLVIFSLSVIPGMPLFVMLPIGALLFFASFFQKRNKEKKREKEVSFFDYPLEIQLAREDVIFCSSLNEKLPEVRKKVASHLGFSFPSIHISESGSLAASHWRILIKGIVVSEGNELELSQLLEELSRIIEKHAHELITRQDVALMLKEAKKIDSAVVEELSSKKILTGQLIKILQNLLKEGIPIRNFVTILEILADQSSGEKIDFEQLTEKVRVGLSKNISEEFFGKKKLAHVIQIDPKVEAMLDISAKFRPKVVDQMAQEIFRLSNLAEKKGIKAVVITTSGLRSRLKKCLEKNLPEMPVLSYSEISGDIEMKTIGTVSNEVLI